MQMPDLNGEQLRQFFDQKEFVSATVAQINKDLQGLAYADFEYTFSTEKNHLQELSTQLKTILLELSKRQPEQLSQFIYKVDLQERKFIASLEKDLTLHDLALLIVEREALKIYLRQKFSNQP